MDIPLKVLYADIHNINLFFGFLSTDDFETVEFGLLALIPCWAFG